MSGPGDKQGWACKMEPGVAWEGKRGEKRISFSKN